MTRTAVPTCVPAANQSEADSPTNALVLQAKQGDQLALEALLHRCLPRLRRWARGRLPRAARATLDTGDLVQEVAFRAVTHLQTFNPAHPGAIHAYLRQSVANRILDERRRLGRRPAFVEMDERLAADGTTPFQFAVRRQASRRYFAALMRLRPKDRQVLLARVQLQYSLEEIARRFHLNSAESARMTVNRALDRLKRAVKDREA